jgi:hypothetical protein
MLNRQPLVLAVVHIHRFEYSRLHSPLRDAFTNPLQFGVCHPV